MSFPILLSLTQADGSLPNLRQYQQNMSQHYYCKILKMSPSMHNPSKYKPPPQTRNARNPLLNPPPKISPPGGLYLEIALKYKVEQSKNGKLLSNYKASPVEFQTQIFLHR